ncbi:MAG TPA: DUF1592 domain-containing protein [Polyangia bacterium]
MSSTNLSLGRPRRPLHLAIPFSLGLMGLACTGSVTDGMEGPGSPPGVNEPGTGGPGTGTKPPPDLPPDAPITGFISSVPAPSAGLLRLSHAQWDNTVRDLFRMSQAPGLSKMFVNEGLRSHFDNQSAEFEVTKELWADYNRAANSLATKIVRDPAALATVLPAGAGDPETRAKTFIKGFGERAYRRPLTDVESTQYLELYRKGNELIGSGDNHLDGIELVVAAFLQAPDFLYRVEVGTGVKNGRIALTDYEVASRLSYGLLNTMPDDQLFAAAAAKKLTTKEGVLEQARRLIESPTAQKIIRDINIQTMRDVDPTELVRDVKLHPLFKAGMGLDMRRETETFLDDIIFKQKKGVHELLTATHTFVNAKTAPVYGVQASGDAMTRVELNPAQRAGLYTQLGFLSTTATENNPRPVKRAVTLSLNLLCVEVPPPPPEVEDPKAPTLANRTNRQAFEAATEEPGTICVSCHKELINPLGFAFENYDSLGVYRTQDKGLPIDASATYKFAEGPKSYKNALELMKTIAEGKQAHDCYAEHMFQYVYGRAAKDAEHGLTRELGRRSRLKKPIKDLVLDLVATDAFLTRAP